MAEPGYGDGTTDETCRVCVRTVYLVRGRALSGRPEIIAYVPILSRSNSAKVQIEVLPHRDGGVVLPAYTSLEQLARCLGSKQAWMALDEKGLIQVKAATNYRFLLIDKPIAPELRYREALKPAPPKGQSMVIDRGSRQRG